MIKCIVIDDEPPAIEVMKMHISRCPFLNLVAATTDAVEGLRLINEGDIQLAFMDIDMPEISGLQLAEAVKGKCKIILATAYTEHALQGYNMDVLDYLVKPVPLARFLQAAEKAKAVLTASGSTRNDVVDDFIMIRGDAKGKYTKVEYAEIDYVEGSGNYITFHCGAKKILSLLNLKIVEEKLAAHSFFRVHKSFIISINKIAKVEADSVFMKGIPAVQIPIGHVYKQLFLERIKQQFLG